jgi:hypothetical protein
MLLEDYFDAVLFKAYGVPPARKWVEEFRHRDTLASFGTLM